MARYDVSVLGFGDNVVDKYEHIKTMYPGGNAVNFAVFAKQLGAARSAYMSQRPAGPSIIWRPSRFHMRR